jgi:hypothetical protein
MKKKFKNVIACVLTGLICFSAVACTSSGMTDEQTAAIELAKQSVGRLTPLSINDFENPNDMHSIYADMNNSVFLETETAYSGKQSLKIWKKKGQFSNTSIGFVQELDMRGKGDFTDLSLAKMLGYWVYNDSDEALEIKCSLGFIDNMRATYSQIVEPKRWTHVIHEIRREMLPGLTCNSINIAIPAPSKEEERVCYVDDLTFYQSTKGASRVVIKRAEHEVYSFDWSKQISGCSFWNGGASEVTAKWDKSTFTKDGLGTSLHLVSTAGATSQGRWPALTLEPSTVYSFPWAYYDGNDEFCFDYYVPEDTGFPIFWVNFITTDYNRFFHPSVPITARGEWLTYSITVDEILAWKNKGSGGAPYSQEATFDKIMQIRFDWQEYNEPEKSYELYIDNIRMKVNPNG